MRREWRANSPITVKNVLFAKYFPISTSSAFDNMGMPYDITAVVDENGFFDVEKYKAYSPLFMPVNLQLAYGTQFAMITAVVVHTFRKPISTDTESMPADHL